MHLGLALAMTFERRKGDGKYLTSRFLNWMLKVVTSVLLSWELGLKKSELYYCLPIQQQCPCSPSHHQVLHRYYRGQTCAPCTMISIETSRLKDAIFRYPCSPKTCLSLVKDHTFLMAYISLSVRKFCQRGIVWITKLGCFI